MESPIIEDGCNAPGEARQDVRYSTLGGACESGGPSGDCRQAGVPSGADNAYCSPGGGTCGGPGATCRFNEESGTCCQTGQTCNAGSCAG